MNDEKGLVGKFKAKVGEIVTMTGSIDGEIKFITVSGFVKKVNYDSVVLSHEDPTNPEDSLFYLCGRNKIGRGDRPYDLEKFDSYEVLSPRTKQ